MQAEEKAWELLASLDPREVCGRALAGFDPSAGAYAVSVFGMPVAVAPARRTISGSGPDSDVILKKMGYFSRLSILHYLIGAQAQPLAGHLVKPADLKVGLLYFTGSHVLPLDALAVRYARDAEGFLKQGLRFGGEPRAYGDAAVEIHPFPRLPVTLVLWCEDDEFSARADLLFDATCERHVPADILWSVAMLSVKMMLQEPAGR